MSRGERNKALAFTTQWHQQVGHERTKDNNKTFTGVPTVVVLAVATVRTEGNRGSNCNWEAVAAREEKKKMIKNEKNGWIKDLKFMNFNFWKENFKSCRTLFVLKIYLLPECGRLTIFRCWSPMCKSYYLRKSIIFTLSSSFPSHLMRALCSQDSGAQWEL